jgi:hypothetical protein
MNVKRDTYMNERNATKALIANVFQNIAGDKFNPNTSRVYTNEEQALLGARRPASISRSSINNPPLYNPSPAPALPAPASSLLFEAKRQAEPVSAQGKPTPAKKTDTIERQRPTSPKTELIKTLQKELNEIKAKQAQPQPQQIPPPTTIYTPQPFYQPTLPYNNNGNAFINPYNRQPKHLPVPELPLPKSKKELEEERKLKRKERDRRYYLRHKQAHHKPQQKKLIEEAQKKGIFIQ